MRAPAFDFGAELARQAAALQEQEFTAYVARLVDTTTERIVLGALIADDIADNRIPWVEPFASASPFTFALDLEVDDFHELAHKRVLAAIRNLQHRSAPPTDHARFERAPWARCDGATAIHDEIARTDAIAESHAAEYITVEFLTGLALERRETVTWFHVALKRLRVLAQKRINP